MLIKDFPLLRFPNPSSDIANFVNLFQVLYEELKDHVSFSLDDMKDAMVEKNLATSSGFTGDEALKRSFNEYSSLNKLWNQAKSYSEMFRVLGWIHPLGTGRQSFTFTYLGAHVAETKKDWLVVVRESLLGIAYPNQVVESKSGAIIRPFSLLLRTMKVLGGHIYRDEMIIGPLSMTDDRDPAQFAAMVKKLTDLRGDFKRLDAALSSAATKRGIAANTMGNYTRLPISFLKSMGWVQQVTMREVYLSPLGFLRLTDEGRQQVEALDAMLDVRAADLATIEAEVRDALVRVSVYEMLDRSGFEMESLASTITTDKLSVAKFLSDRKATEDTQILFSPFQELAPVYVQGLFPKVGGNIVKANSGIMPTQVILKHLPSNITLDEADQTVADGAEAIEPLIAKMFRDASAATDGTLESIVERLVLLHQKANKNTFYPLVAALFRCLGYACEVSPTGVNARRADAFITDSVHSIPIEIKSPGEEINLSVKAVRQAAENKVILLSRKAAPTTMDTTSLAVGFNPPNNRSEVNSVIDDIYKAFGIVIGVIDFRSLLTLAGARILDGKQHDKEEFRKLHGIIKLPDA